jgi:hypothetical protein
MQSEVLYRLIDAISDLVCHHGLQTSTKGDAVQALARAHLFVALRQLDGLHKGLALQFLYEANLIGSHAIAERAPTPPVIALNGADLAGLSLPNANFGWAHLAVADIARARLHNACLIRANLYAVDLIDADLSHANLTGAKLFAQRVCLGCPTRFRAGYQHNAPAGQRLSEPGLVGAPASLPVNQSSHRLRLALQLALFSSTRIRRSVLPTWVLGSSLRNSTSVGTL